MKNAFGASFFERLSHTRVVGFDEQMLAHAQRHFPHVAEALGPDRTAVLLRDAIDSAPQHGFVNERCVARWVNLKFHYGPTFPEANGFNWAREILGDRLHAKMDRLVSMALTHGIA